MAKSLLSKQRRTIWTRRIKGFWEEYRSNKIGLVGLIFVTIYVLAAILAPWLTPYNPIESRDIADGFAMPAWMTIFPQFRRLPRTVEPATSWSVKEADPSIEVIEIASDLAVQYSGEDNGIQSTNFTTSFLFPYSAPKEFTIEFNWRTEYVRDAEYSLELYMSNPAGRQFILWTSYSAYPSKPFSSKATNFTSEKIFSDGLHRYVLGRLEIGKLQNVPEKIFLQPGEYKLMVSMMFRSKSAGTAEIHFKSTKLRIYGLVHGILGTDALGRDIFSQLIYGAQISLAVGLLSALLSTSIGISVGVISGYTGGAVDEGLMRTVDILLCLPMLPLLLGLIVLFGTNVWYLVLIIALFGWLGLSRLIRSQVLSLKEMPFVECAKASGAGKFYIMFKHMVPNVLPVALAALILSIPAAILTEAAISFIGLGDPSAPTWGRMLHSAFGMGGFWHLAWWWIIPPGLAITILTVSFVFIGHAVDEVVNPRLRRRR